MSAEDDMTDEARSKDDDERGSPAPDEARSKDDDKAGAPGPDDARSNDDDEELPREPDEGDDDEPGPPPKPAIAPKASLSIAIAVTIATGGVVRYAFAAEQAGSAGMLVAMAAGYAPFAALAVWAMHKEGRLSEIKPQRGDLAFGALLAGVMYGAAMAVRQLALASDSPRSWWIARIYLQLGDPSNNRMLYVGLAVLAVAVLEEIVWRGLVMRSLRAPFGPMRAWLFSSVLYALSHVPTLHLLEHPVAGPNPLVVIAALGGGLVWGHLYNRMGRLGPSLFAHAIFTWAIVDFPLWRP